MTSRSPYHRELSRLLQTLPVHVSPATVQALAEEAATPPGDFQSELPHAYVIALEWLAFKRSAAEWTTQRMNAFYAWCKADRQRMARLREINNADKKSLQQMQHAGRAVGRLCQEFTAPAPRRTRASSRAALIV